MANYDFAGKVLVLTGASGGIGRATANYFFNCGANVALTYHRNEAIKEMARELDLAGERSLATRVDLASSKACDDFAAQCRERFGCADFLVNNAAVLRMAPVETMTNETWREVITVDVEFCPDFASPRCEDLEFPNR